MQPSHSARKRRRSDGVGVENHPSGDSNLERETKCILISYIHVTNVVARLRRIPVGFYVALESEDISRRSSIKLASVLEDKVEWNEDIIVPSNLTSRISLTVFASFELGSTLGSGEILFQFDVTLGELLDRNGRLESIRRWETSDGEILSSCSYCHLKIEQRTYGREEYMLTSDLLESEVTCRLAELTDKGHCALALYRERETEQCLNEAIGHFENAQESCPLDHLNRDTVLFNLASAKMMHCRVNRSPPELDAAIDLYRRVLDLRPKGHLDHGFTLLNLGIALQARFQRKGTEVDEEEGRTFLSRALEAVHVDSYAYHAAILALGSTAWSELIQSAEDPRGSEEEPDDDDTKVERLDATLQSIFLFDSSNHELLDHLGVLFCVRLDCLAQLVDSEKGIPLLEAMVKLTHEDHPDKPSWLDDLSTMFWSRYEHLGDINDLDKSVSAREEAARLLPDDDADKPGWLSNLAKLFSVRYEHCGDESDMDKSVSAAEETVRLTPDGDPDKPGWLSNIGNSLLTRYEHLGNVVDLENSILKYEDAVQRTSDGHLNKPAWLNALGDSLSTRYTRFGEIDDLERSIICHESALGLAVDGHPDKFKSLNNVGNSLFMRYKHFGDISDLEKSITKNQEAVQLVPDDHPDVPRLLNELGRSLLARFEHKGDVGDLKEAILVEEQAVQLTVEGDTNKPMRLNNLGESLLACYNHQGDVADLEKSISIYEEAMGLMPDGFPGKPILQNNLGNSLHIRYERFGKDADLERLISIHEEAVQRTPDGHPDKPLLLNSLGCSLFIHYERFGNVLDLEKSVSILEEALQLTRDDDPYKPARLNNLGNSLSTRFESFGDTADLEKMISARELSVKLTPDGHADKPVLLSNLGNSYAARYERFREDVDLDRSISMHEDALRLSPDDHPYKPEWLSDLGNSWLALFEHSKNNLDLEKAISRHEEAVGLIAEDHPDKPVCLNSLGNSLLVRYQCNGNVADLEKSISVNERAVQLTDDDGHPDKPLWLTTLARSLLKRFQRSDDFSRASDLPRAISYASQAARSATGSSISRFRATQLWIECARLLPQPEAGDSDKPLLDAYAVAVHLLPQLAWIGLPLHDRHHQLLRSADVVCDAVATVLQFHLPEQAVEWLEQGRSVVWHQLSQLRTPVDDLRVAYPELAAQFEHVSFRLERAVSTRNRDTVSKEMKASGSFREKQTQQHHALALSRERLLTQIRALQGFERFLLPKTIDQLVPLARYGPVVFLNASRYRCDALIVTARRESEDERERVIHVPLSMASYSTLMDMQMRLRSLLRLTGRVADPSQDDKNDEVADRGARLKGMDEDQVFGSILPYLWDKVVGPILQVLAFDLMLASNSKLPCIFWCPTGLFTFLLIHAAGHYDTANKGPKISDFAISSYIPGMSALDSQSAPCIQDPPDLTSTHVTRDHIHLLTVRQPSTDGQTVENLIIQSRF